MIALVLASGISLLASDGTLDVSSFFAVAGCSPGVVSCATVVAFLAAGVLMLFGGTLEFNTSMSF
jgi:hypothetical protein